LKATYKRYKEFLKPYSEKISLPLALADGVIEHPHLALAKNIAHPFKLKIA
jgi:hypothetical protein